MTVASLEMSDEPEKLLLAGKLSEGKDLKWWISVAEGITAAEIDEAKKRKAYISNAANVWKKDRNGFYI